MRHLGVCKSALRWRPDVVTDDSLVSYGSNAEDPSMSAAGPLHPAQRTNAEASLNDCMCLLQ